MMVNLTEPIATVNNWEELLDLLRDELQEYGGLIGLLNAQQQSILSRKPDSLLEINQSVQAQMEASQILQKEDKGMFRILQPDLVNPPKLLLRNFYHACLMLLNPCLRASSKKSINLFQMCVEKFLKISVF